MFTGIIGTKRKFNSETSCRLDDKYAKETFASSHQVQFLLNERAIKLNFSEM